MTLSRSSAIAKVFDRLVSHYMRFRLRHPWALDELTAQQFREILANEDMYEGWQDAA